MVPVPSPRSKRRARIEIIPLIDIIFFLLATFVMVSLSMVRNKGIPVHLPAASASTNQNQTEYSAISITENGDLYLDKNLVTEEELATELKRIAAEEDPKIVIYGDEKALVGKLVAVMDETKQAGIAKVAIATKPKEKQALP